LTWNSTNATSCIASGDWSGGKNLSDSETVNGLVIDSQYMLTCDGPGGSTSDTAVVTVVLSNNGTALLSWEPPTQNTDGSLLEDLAGYKIYYGTSPGVYSQTIVLDDKTLTSYLVENLGPAQWYFKMTAYNELGLESVDTEELSKTIQ
jgi:hypothetical protein